MRLIRLLAGAAAAADTAEAAVNAQRLAVAEEFGWDPDRDDHSVVLDRLAIPGKVIWQSFQDADGAEAPDSVTENLEAFEEWYQTHAGQPFYVLFDQYVPQAPLVDF